MSKHNVDIEKFTKEIEAERDKLAKFDVSDQIVRLAYRILELKRQELILTIRLQELCKRK